MLYANIERIWLVTTSDGPRLPDYWFVLEGQPVPTEAAGFDTIWDELKQRDGFDSGPPIPVEQ